MTFSYPADHAFCVLMIVARSQVCSPSEAVINLALEGIMIFGAFIGVLAVRLLQSSEAVLAAKAAKNWAAMQGYELLAMLAAAVMGAVFSCCCRFASINLRADQTIGGTALNLLAPALVLFFVRIIANQNTLQMQEGDAASWFMIKKTTLGFERTPTSVSSATPCCTRSTFATYICIILFIVLSIILYKTKFGLRLRLRRKSSGSRLSRHQRL